MTEFDKKAQTTGAAPNVTPSVISSIVDLAETTITRDISLVNSERISRTSPLAVLGDFFKDLKALKEMLLENGLRKPAVELTAAVADLRNSLPKGRV